MKWLFVCAWLFLSCEGERPTDLGVKNGRFKACPSSPNCVSSQATDKEHYIPPIPFKQPTYYTQLILMTELKRNKKYKVITNDSLYIHAEFKTTVGFVDDVEFFVSPDEHVIHVRSASRIGYSDFGANRKRIEELRETIMDRLNKTPKHVKQQEDTMPNPLFENAPIEPAITK